MNAPPSPFYDIVPAELRSDEIRTEFVAANGLTFEVDKCGDGDKLAICLHGFPEHAFSWRYQLPMLASMGYEAWAPNLRGYGKSSRPPRIEDYKLDDLMADFVTFLCLKMMSQVIEVTSRDNEEEFV